MTRKLSARWMWMTAALVLAVGLLTVAQNRRTRPATPNPTIQDPSQPGPSHEDKVEERAAFINDTGSSPESRAREAQQASGASTPNWTNKPHFLKDVFTFCRVHYTV